MLMPPFRTSGYVICGLPVCEAEGEVLALLGGLIHQEPQKVARFCWNVRLL